MRLNLVELTRWKSVRHRERRGRLLNRSISPEQSTLFFKYCRR